jgi:hypothetical protein
MSLYQKPFIPKQEQKVELVRLYDADTNEVFGTFDNFYKATEFITSRKYSVVYLDEFPRDRLQEWGLRVWE